MTDVELDIDQLKKMASIIANEQMKAETNLLKKHSPKKVHIIEPLPVEQNDIMSDFSSPVDCANGDNTHVSNNSGSATDICTKNSTTIHMFGLNVPSQTLYFVLVLIVLGAVIWYLTREKSHTKKTRDEEDE